MHPLQTEGMSKPPASDTSSNTADLSWGAFSERGPWDLDRDKIAWSEHATVLRREARALKECVADLTLENRLLKKSMIADGGDDE